MKLPEATSVLRTVRLRMEEVMGGSGGLYAVRHGLGDWEGWPVEEAEEEASHLALFSACRALPAWLPSETVKSLLEEREALKLEAALPLRG